MKYQVWIIARDPKTLQPIAEVLVFEHEERRKAEHYNEGYTRIKDNARFLFGPVVLGQDPIYNTETRIPGWGALGGSAGRVGGAPSAGGAGARAFGPPRPPGRKCPNCGKYCHELTLNNCLWCASPLPLHRVAAPIMDQAWLDKGIIAGGSDDGNTQLCQCEHPITSGTPGGPYRHRCGRCQRPHREM